MNRFVDPLIWILAVCTAAGPLALTAHGQITWHVPSDAPTIEAAISAASEGDTIVVGPGDWSPPAQLEPYNFLGKNLRLVSSHGPAQTSLVSVSGWATFPVVRFENGEGPSALLEGFTIRGGVTSAYANTAGVKISNASPTVRGNVFDGVKALRGGGLWIGPNSSARIEDNRFVNCYASDQGGALFIQDASPLLRRNVICNNRAFNGGGGISIWGSTTGSPTNAVPRIEACTLFGNSTTPVHSGGRGGAIHIGMWNGTVGTQIVHALIRDCIVWGNTSANAPGIAFHSSGSLTIEYTDTQESWGGPGMLVANPLFRAAAAGDFGLLSGSPCVDAGSPASPLDPDGSRADMGAVWFCAPPAVYGTGKLASHGLTPSVGWNGEPSVSAASFEVTVQQAVPQRAGLFFWGATPASTPFVGGYKLVASPTLRLPILQTDAAGSASQVITIDASMLGARRCYQFWFRDPQHTDGTAAGLSDGLEVTFCP